MKINVAEEFTPLTYEILKTSKNQINKLGKGTKANLKGHYVVLDKKFKLHILKMYNIN